MKKEIVAIFPTNNWAGYWFRDVSIFLKAKQPDQWKTDLKYKIIESKDLKVYFRSQNSNIAHYDHGILRVEFDSSHREVLDIYNAIIDAVNSQEGAKASFKAIAEGIKKASSAESDT